MVLLMVMVVVAVMMTVVIVICWFFGLITMSAFCNAAAFGGATFIGDLRTGEDGNPLFNGDAASFIEYLQTEVSPLPLPSAFGDIDAPYIVDPAAFGDAVCIGEATATFGDSTFIGDAATPPQ